MAARILAALAAVAMVVGSVAVRARIDDRPARPGTTLRLACSSDLAPVCRALQAEGGPDVEATVQADAETASVLTAVEPGGRAPFDGWLTTAPWPAIVAKARARVARGPLLEVGGVLARSPVVLAVRADRREVLTGHCGAEPGWRCLGEVAGTPWAGLDGGRAEWGTVKPGLPPVGTTAGLAVLGGATAAYFDGAVEAAALTRDELDDPGFVEWLRRLERAVPARPPSPFQTLLLRPAFDAVGVLEAEAVPGAASAAGAKPVLFYPSPVATADVVLATTGGRTGRLLDALLAGTGGRRALAGGGWRVDGEPPAGGPRSGVALPPTANLPGPGVLEALRTRVERIR